jgi:hypothetical protein
VTVRDWLMDHVRGAPDSLVAGMIAALGSDAEAPAARAGELCVASAARALDRLLEERHFQREHALDLLIIDALATVAFEHAAETLSSDDAIADSANRATRAFSRLAVERV